MTASTKTSTGFLIRKMSKVPAGWKAEFLLNGRPEFAIGLTLKRAALRAQATALAHNAESIASNGQFVLFARVNGIPLIAEGEYKAEAIEALTELAFNRLVKAAEAAKAA